ncbi:MAG: 50S ribosomal protein L14e [Candidatus Aenigmarchaeota archaeon]|nr:50S ribosomal protein L14e [Candidatus Aenigmarchaeota archaeon]MDW8149200.1 50S ribosomal protein L14e [Candidatus Aenigmarchaeota archaeon]
MEVGRICRKIAGREAGKYCVVLKKIDENFVLVTGPKQVTGVKRRKCNITHLQPTEHKIEIKEEASDEEVAKALNEQGILTKLNLKMAPAHSFKNASTKGAS